ncbi:hypothetical protein [Roseovarius sp. EL26]|uniref:hypothetical protein n=1 Tax=Roseovarius sp. EL26 TaxID=2126672 RepID=UPI000EA3D56F|nr:hypothetical protein [Roseovarius sp. EL26]
MIGTGDGNIQRNVKVGATLLCAFMMGHVMQNTLQHTSVPSVNVQSFLNGSATDHTGGVPNVSDKSVVLNNIVQTSAIQMKAASLATPGSLMHVAYAPELSPDLPISKLPSEVPAPVLAIQTD